MLTKDILLEIVAPNGDIVELQCYSSDVERCYEINQKLRANPGIHNYCKQHWSEEKVNEFLKFLGNFILGEELAGIEINERPNILNVRLYQ